MVSYPIEEGKGDRLKDAVGILGLKFMQLSYDTDYLSANASVDEIRKLFDKLTERGDNACTRHVCFVPS